MSFVGYDKLKVYYGDLHSHCDIGYGHGPVEEAYQNARTQLDFASVTAHAHWPDIPEGSERLASVVAYHRKGFQRAKEQWQRFQEVTEGFNRDHQFITFLSFEWHSLRHGDHNVYFKEAQGRIITARSLEEMRAHLRFLTEEGTASFLIPHHIGYLSGYRGIRWEDFSPEFTPVVEMMSMHGMAESTDGPFPYLHTMGPRDERSTVQYGLRTGHVFGVIGSTDHHSAHPGSYGHGRAAVWATELSRDGIWEAIAARRTYALTGDRIALAFSLNAQPMGSLVPANTDRRIEISVVGGSALDYVEIIYNNRCLNRWSVCGPEPNLFKEPVKVFLEVGWGQKDIPVDWHVTLEVVEGSLLSAEPRFRGRDIVAPQASGIGRHAFSSWDRIGENSVSFVTQTWGNPTTTTPSTQGISLELLGAENTKIQAVINGHQVTIALGELVRGSRSGYLGGFLAPAYCFHRAVSRDEYAYETSLQHAGDGKQRDWYYVRVRQKNGQWAWSSPIWVEAS